MKFLLLVGTILNSLSAQAGTPVFITCKEFKYSNVIRVDLDLQQMKYRVIKTMTPGGRDELLVAGRVVAPSNIYGAPKNFRLFQSSTEVGYLNLTNESSTRQHAFLRYGKNYFQMAEVFCTSR
jgi:hypothetical protein